MARFPVGLDSGRKFASSSDAPVSNSWAGLERPFLISKKKKIVSGAVRYHAAMGKGETEGETAH